MNALPEERIESFKNQKKQKLNVELQNKGLPAEVFLVSVNMKEKK